MLALGCDHGGYPLMKEVIKYLEDNKIEFKNFGTYSEASVDYPEYAKKVAHAVADGECEKGILICGTGIGISIAANKVKGIRCALCGDVFSAKATREHNDANILAMGARVTGPGLALEIVKAFLETPFSNDERHIRRIKQIEDLEGRSMSKLFVSEHPLIHTKMAMLRDEQTGTKEFREIIGEVASLLLYEATRDLPLKEVQVKTPIATATCKTVDTKLATVPILRAGLGMTDGILNLLPAAKIGHIGLYRDETTLEPVEYYCKLPTDIEERTVFLTDPMLATGGSADAAIGFLKARGVKNIIFLCILAASEGVERLQKNHPDVDIYAAAYDDSGLNEHGYIVPGLGDAGDRIFGTK